MFSLDAIKFLASEKKNSCIFPYSPLPMSDDGGHLPFLNLKWDPIGKIFQNYSNIRNQWNIWANLAGMSLWGGGCLVLRRNGRWPPSSDIGSGLYGKMHEFFFSEARYCVLLCLSLSCVLCAQYCQCLWIVHSLFRL
jgi:hypothetical protein